MASLFALAFGLSSFGLPVIAFALLLASKVTADSKKMTESLFIASLTLVTLVTLRTVMTNDPALLTHTLTLAMMVLGAVWLPSMHPQAEA